MGIKSFYYRSVWQSDLWCPLGQISTRPQFRVSAIDSATIPFRELDYLTQRVVGSVGHTKPMKLQKTIKEKKWSKPEAKLKISFILDQMPGIDELDIADILRIPLKSACELCDEMVKEGKIRRTTEFRGSYVLPRRRNKKRSSRRTG